MHTVLAPRLAILDPEIKLIFVLLGSKLSHMVNLLLSYFLLVLCSFSGREGDSVNRLVDLRRDEHSSYTVSNEHLLLSDPLFDEVDDFARLAIGCRLFYVQILQSIVDCLDLNLVQFGDYLLP